MQRLDMYLLTVAVVSGVVVRAGAPAARGQACTCDFANADIAPCGGPDAAVSFGDIQFIDYCVENQADFCGRPLSVCDINCDGIVDFRDYGEALEAFFAGEASGPCLGAYGACCSINQTNCVLTTSRGCTVLDVDPIPGDGVYAGDDSVCDPNPCDCNGNGIEDDLDLIDGTSFDCNNNGDLDECDLANGFAFDVMPANGVPDECDPLNRYLFFSMDDLVPNALELQAIRVTLVNIDGFGGFNAEVRWVGPAIDAPEQDSSDPTRTFRAAQLECSSHYADWGTGELVYIDGGEMVPGSLYAIQAIGESCNEAQESCYTAPDQWVLATGAWGDVAGPFTGSGAAQPDFLDIASIVEKFLGEPLAPPKPRFQLVPNVVFPERDVDFKDISAGVAAFVGEAYADYLGSGVGPCICPSSVTCGATSCFQDVDCGVGFCIGGFCTDACKRCSP